MSPLNANGESRIDSAPDQIQGYGSIVASFSVTETEGSIVVRNKINKGKGIVLVVDDDRDIRESMSEQLLAEGYPVIEAENGQEALNELERAPETPCVILLDLSMPVLNGREFLSRRATDPVLLKIPVFVISGDRRPTDLLQGIDAYFQKPFRIADLIDAIGRNCEP
jgi:CheY-like chemotaxis protein